MDYRENHNALQLLGLWRRVDQFVSRGGVEGMVHHEVQCKFLEEIVSISYHV